MKVFFLGIVICSIHRSNPVGLDCQGLLTRMGQISITVKSSDSFQDCTCVPELFRHLFIPTPSQFVILLKLFKTKKNKKRS